MIVKHHGKTQTIFDVLLCRQALWLHQARTQVVCSNEEARKRLAEAFPQWTLDTWILFRSDVFVLDLGKGMDIIMIIKTIIIIFCLVSHKVKFFSTYYVSSSCLFVFWFFCCYKTRKSFKLLRLPLWVRSNLLGVYPLGPRSSSCGRCTKGMWAPLIDVLRGCEHPTSH